MKLPLHVTRIAKSQYGGGQSSNCTPSLSSKLLPSFLNFLGSLRPHSLRLKICCLDLDSSPSIWHFLCRAALLPSSISSLFSLAIMFAARQAFNQVQRRAFSASARQVALRPAYAMSIQIKLITFRLHLVLQGHRSRCRRWYWTTSVFVDEVESSSFTTRTVRYQRRTGYAEHSIALSRGPINGKLTTEDRCRCRHQPHQHQECCYRL